MTRDPVLMIVTHKGCLGHFRMGEESFPIPFLYIEGCGSHPGSVCAETRVRPLMLLHSR